MEQELREKFEVIYNEANQDHKLIYCSPSRTRQTLNAMQAAYNLALEDNWVSSWDAMPDNKKWVLVYVDERKMSFMSYRDNGYWCGPFEDVINNNTASKWTDLPQPPQSK